MRRALLDRELAVLELAEAMLAAEVEANTLEAAKAEELLRRHKQDAKEAEAEASRVSAGEQQQQQQQGWP